ncbi:hypothetical protein B0H13DRAFT_2360413 [Mycena leptocephala]|nr:hypothetical protein B0H13DRAFT_2360413 [Mycena leptocephala]
MPAWQWRCNLRSATAACSLVKGLVVVGAYRSPSRRARSPHPLFLPLPPNSAASAAHAEITIYHANNQAAFSTAVTQPTPPVSTPTMLTTIPMNIFNSGTNLPVKQKGSFIGFSIEMSLTNQWVKTRPSSKSLLNLMANFQQRAGSVMVRIGRNTQEFAKLVIPDGRVLIKNLTSFGPNLLFLAVEKYPRDVAFGGPDAIATDPQSTLPLYLTHDAHTELLASYLNATAYAQSVGKPFLMFETNAVWLLRWLQRHLRLVHRRTLGLDYALQMAHSNFSGAMFHLGGKSFYNPSTSPPTNESTFHQWTVDALHYSALVMAEAIGPPNETQVLNHGVADLTSFTPIYGIYENGVPVRVAIFNYVHDPSGANTVRAVISIAGASMPASVRLKYLPVTTVVQKGGYTWAGQCVVLFLFFRLISFLLLGFPSSSASYLTYPPTCSRLSTPAPFTLKKMLYTDIRRQLRSDGCPTGTVRCDETAQTCTIDVPAPGFALAPGMATSWIAAREERERQAGRQ